MACSHPLTIYVPSQKRSYNMPCRHCLCCRLQRMQYLQLCARAELLYQYKAGFGASFVTLTYDDAHLPPFGSLCKKDMQDYLKVLRINIKRKAPVYRGFKYIACGEYGDKFGRPHYHLVFLGLANEVINTFADKWFFGLSDVKPLTAGGIRYVLKYCLKQVGGRLKDEMYTQNGLQAPFITRSCRLGEAWLLDNLDVISGANFMYQFMGRQVSLPSYLRKKIDTRRFYDVDGLLVERAKVAREQGFSDLYDYDAEFARRMELKLALEYRANGVPVDLNVNDVYKPTVNIKEILDG